MALKQELILEYNSVYFVVAGASGSDCSKRNERKCYSLLEAYWH